MKVKAVYSDTILRMVVDAACTIREIETKPRLSISDTNELLTAANTGFSAAFQGLKEAQWKLKKTDELLNVRESIYTYIQSFFKTTLKDFGCQPSCSAYLPSSFQEVHEQLTKAFRVIIKITEQKVITKAEQEIILAAADIGLDASVKALELARKEADVFKKQASEETSLYLQDIKYFQSIEKRISSLN